MSKHVFIVAGDPSADQHGSALAEALKRRIPGVKISALGGTHLRQSAHQFIYPLVNVGGFGFWEPVLKLPQLWRAWQRLSDILRHEKPDVVVPMDYYGFNIHVARKAHREHIPVVYYISPQVWATRPGRIQELAKVLTKMLVIFPFEEKLYREAGVPVRYIGHPLLDRIPLPATPNGILRVGLFPGSRPEIAQRHLPLLAQTAKELKREFPEAQFILFRPEEREESFYQSVLSQAPWIQVVYDPTYEKRQLLSLAITVSGTAALENTLLGIPMIIMYKLSPLTYVIARRLIRIPFVGIPNILAGEAIVPELLQQNASPEKLAQTAQTLLKNPSSLRQTRDSLLAVRRQLGDPGSSDRAAEEISQVL